MSSYLLFVSLYTSQIFMFYFISFLFQ